MKQCIALAGVACLLASGCAQSGLLGRKSCSKPCYVAQSQNAPRPKIVRNGCRACGVQLCSNDCEEAGCGQCDQGVGCGDPCCHSSCNDRAAACQGACNNGCNRMVNRIASGGCDPGRCAGGMCPNCGTYPEATAYNPGPAVGQVAYPYYTVRGPRDFLRDKPPTIGPY
jgi:hypothetical protein